MFFQLVDDSRMLDPPEVPHSSQAMKFTATEQIISVSCSFSISGSLILEVLHCFGWSDNSLLPPLMLPFDIFSINRFEILLVDIVFLEAYS